MRAATRQRTLAGARAAGLADVRAVLRVDVEREVIRLRRLLEDVGGVDRTRSGGHDRAGDRRRPQRATGRALDLRHDVRVVVGVARDPAEEAGRARERLAPRVDVVDARDEVDTLETGDERVRAEDDLRVDRAANVAV